MESHDELQQQEITALRSIYADDFIDSPPPKAWKGAARLPEFSIRVTHPDPRHATKVSFLLSVKLPKSYPSKTHPIFTIEKPIQGLNAAHVSALNNGIQAEAQRNQGSEMVFQVVSYCQDWLDQNVHPPTEAPGASLASEMEERALQAERERKAREEAEAAKERERSARLAAQLRQEILEDAQRKEEMQKLEKERHRARKRAVSDATERPPTIMTSEQLDEPITVDGVTFDTIKLYQPRAECLGKIYNAEPICEDVHADPIELQLHTITFDSNYYCTNQGRKKLRQVENEVQRLIKIRHPNLIRVHAVKLHAPKSNETPRLSILSDPHPTMTMVDILRNCDSLREERAKEYVCQILAALHALHMADLVHRGIDIYSIRLASSVDQQSSTVKLCKPAYFTKLKDMHKSDPFGSYEIVPAPETVLSDDWQQVDVVDSPLVYTRNRDIHAVGVVLLQMLLGIDVVGMFPDPISAIQSSNLSPQMQKQITCMVATHKKPTSCLALLAKFSEMSIPSSTKFRTLALSDESRTVAPRFVPGSPEKEFFRPFGFNMNQSHHSSRWKDNWEELELLGKGGFGSVVKAKNKLDNRIYAVKKIKLRTAQNDSKIFREVDALSRLSHRNIVRYYTTWLEAAEPSQSAMSSGSESDASDDDGKTSVPNSEYPQFDDVDPFTIDLDDLRSESRSSFPSIHFSTEDGDDTEAEDESSEEEMNILFEKSLSVKAKNPDQATPTPPIAVNRTLYIQMEYVERQTLRERISEGLSEDEALRLFQQIVDALVHMHSLGILHRDIKLNNIFIDAHGDCKVGDFGLATSSLAAVDPSDVSPSTTIDSEMTLEVGTRLYIAPEVLDHRAGPRNHSKADMYSLGIVFFEMNHAFSTGTERIVVLENLRKHDIIFPPTWDSKRGNQQSIITWLLQHNPRDRPTALELSKSPLLPARIEDEYFKGALDMMAKPDSPHYQAVIQSLFSQPPRPARGFLYDLDMQEHAALSSKVQERMAEIFRLHGAVDMEAPLLMPHTKQFSEEQRQVLMLDRHGEVVALPSNALVPFARLAARINVGRIKRFHVGDIFRDNAVAGHPKVSKAAVFDIITPDLSCGGEAASAELIVIIDELLSAFPNVGPNYEIHVSHSRIAEVAFAKIPSDLQSSVIDILAQTKSSVAQKRALLLKKGLARNICDELELLLERYDNLEQFVVRLEKGTLPISEALKSAFEDIQKTVSLAVLTGVKRQIYIRPLMIGKHQSYFRNGICFEVVRRNKKLDILAAGGRYDHMIRAYSPPSTKSESVYAMGVQIAVEKITVSLATYQSASVSSLVREQKSYGYWTARRCDVYIVSFQPGYMRERLEVAALLWRNGISADIMYETGVVGADLESVAELCSREGILFLVYPRPRSARRELLTFKIKSVLKGSEYEVSRQDLVGWLQHEIAEQKRIDTDTSGISVAQENGAGHALPKENSFNVDVQLLLPGETKKRKQAKSLFLDRAYETCMRIKNAFQSGGMAMLAVDVTPAVFELMIRNDLWLSTDDETASLSTSTSAQVAVTSPGGPSSAALSHGGHGGHGATWRAIAAGFPPTHSGYAQQIREALRQRREDGYKFMLLFSVKDERVGLISFST